MKTSTAEMVCPVVEVLSRNINNKGFITKKYPQINEQIFIHMTEELIHVALIVYFEQNQN